MELVQEMFWVLDLMGTCVFAITGCVCAKEKKLDWFGATLVGLVAATGGGTIRDILLGVDIFWIQNPIYIYLIIITVFVFVTFVKYSRSYSSKLLDITDALGLAAFSAIGAYKAIEANMLLHTVIIIAVLTGCAGGVLRDILVNNIPLVMHKEIYAIASIFTAIIIYTLYEFNINKDFAMLSGFLVAFFVRMTAIKYKICLPQLK